MTELRIWAEDLEQENTIRFTWKWLEAPELDPEDDAASIVSALAALDGVHSAEKDDDGVVVEFDPALVTRVGLADAIREALGASKPEPVREVDDTRVRVWAEDLSAESVRLTWQTPEWMGERDEPSDRRRVAAWLMIQPEVRSARLDGDGVLVTYQPDEMQRRKLAELVRSALAIEEDLKTRANGLVKRAPVYGNLARKLALDERISPIPDAARQAAARRGNPAMTAGRQTALRMIPGGLLISRIQTLLPVIQSLMAWSQEAPPEVVEEHLASVGLDRQTLEADNATAQEARLFARDFASEKAAELTDRAAVNARKAIDFGRDWIESRRAAMDPSTEADPALESQPGSPSEPEPDKGSGSSS